MTAGERIFVDLLPDSWTARRRRCRWRWSANWPSARAPPSARLRAAARRRRARKKRPPVRVRASVQPTFVRFVFEMPDGVGVSSVLNEQKLTLLFNAALTFDLADAKVAAPPNVASINQKIEGDTSAVEVALIGDVDVHSFREEKNYIVDVAFQQADKTPVASRRRCAGCLAGQPASAGRRRPPRKPRCDRRSRGSPARSRRRRRRRSPSRPGSRSSPTAPHSVPTSRSRAERQAGAEAEPPKPRRSCAAGGGRSRRPPRSRRRAVAPARCRAGDAAAPEMAAPLTKPPKPRRRRQAQAPAGDAKGRSRSQPRRQSGASRRQPAATATVDAQARQRRPARDLLLCRADARGVVPPRRHGVAGVRFRRSRSTSSRSAPRAARSSARSAALPLEKGQAIRIRLNRPQMPSLTSDEPHRRHELDADLRRHDAGAAAAADGDRATSPIPRSPMSPCRWPIPACCTGSSIPTPATRCWWSPRRRRSAASSSGRISSNCRCWNPPMASRSGRIPTTSPPRSRSDKVMLGKPGGLTLSSADVAAERATDRGAAAVRRRGMAQEPGRRTFSRG